MLKRLQASKLEHEFNLKRTGSLDEILVYNTNAAFDVQKAHEVSGCTQ